MEIEEIIDLVGGWENALAVTPAPGDGTPQIAWGDTFFYYAPDGRMPQRTQPFATIVTKNYPDDETSRLDRPKVFRLNIAALRDPARAGVADDDAATTTDPSALDRLFPHPVYGSMGWLAVLDPGPRSTSAATDLLRQAYEAARARYHRRHDA
jgi:hypothetical protein